MTCILTFFHNHITSLKSPLFTMQCTFYPLFVFAKNATVTMNLLINNFSDHFWLDKIYSSVSDQFFIREFFFSPIFCVTRWDFVHVASTVVIIRWSVKNGFSSCTHQWCLFVFHLQIKNILILHCKVYGFHKSYS